VEVNILEERNFKSEKCNNFSCSNCKSFIGDNEQMGTRWRNHCPVCLYSKHVDLNTPGDRKAECKSRMEPIGLTLKKEGFNEYGEERVGELMLVHRCCNEGCGKISINRLAGDDDVQVIMRLYENSLSLDDELRESLLSKNNITMLTESERDEVESQLFGNGNESK
jgi:hypothetical protein